MMLWLWLNKSYKGVDTIVKVAAADMRYVAGG